MISEAARQNSLIRLELQKYSWKTIAEFEHLLPCDHNKSHIIDIFPKEYFIRSDGFDEYYSLSYLEIESSEDFWQRWNRFKKLKAFL